MNRRTDSGCISVAYRQLTTSDNLLYLAVEITHNSKIQLEDVGNVQ